MQHTVIPSWYQRDGYIKAMGDLIQKELEKFDQPEEVLLFHALHLFAHPPTRAEIHLCFCLVFFSQCNLIIIEIHICTLNYLLIPL